MVMENMCYLISLQIKYPVHIRFVDKVESKSISIAKSI